MTEKSNLAYPTNEADRLKALKRYQILDTPPDGSFDRITAIASKLLDVPIVIVSLVDQDRIWFKSKYGIEVEEIGRDPGLCASAILSDEIYTITNAIEDPRSLANPLVAGDFGLRFYAAAPLKTNDGFNLGTLCILDKIPRELSDNDKDILFNLAGIVMDEMELRLSSRNAIQLQNELLSIVAHDLKGPLSGVFELSKLLYLDNDRESLNEMADLLKSTSQKMIQAVGQLLESNILEEKSVKLNITDVKLTDLINEIVKANKVLAENKKQILQLNIQSDCIIKADRQKLCEIMDNIINNAIKYSPLSSEIKIITSQTDNKVVIEVSDQGPGLSGEDKNKLFKRFSRLNTKPTGGESQTGLGLFIVKKLLNLHNGDIRAESHENSKGASFIIQLPLTQ